MVEEKEIRRGDVWWISAGTGSDWEQNFGRPAVVISGDTGNMKSEEAIVAFVTSTPSRPSPICPKVEFPEGSRRVLCHKIFTVKQDRFDRKICTLTESEMIRVSGALAVAMCIPQYPAKPVIDAPKTSVDETEALRCERDMWQRMYQTVIDQLVEMRVAADLARRMPEKPKVTKAEVVEEKPVKVKPPVAKVSVPEVVDINYCSDVALREMGLSQADCDNIIACRPFESVLELNCVPDLDTKWVAANEGRLICTPIGSDEPVKKVNLNTCKAKD